MDASKFPLRSDIAYFEIKNTNEKSLSFRRAAHLLVGACGTRPDNLSNRMPESSDSSPKGKAARPQPDKLVVVWAEWNGDKLILTRRPFDPKGKSIEVEPKEYPNGTRIDGLYAWGSEGTLPNVELASFHLEIDEKLYTIPRELWANCYEPNFVNAEEDAWGDSVIMPGISHDVHA